MPRLTLTLLILAAGFLCWHPRSEASLFTVNSCATVLRRQVSADANQITDLYAAELLLAQVSAHYREGEWIEARPSAREFIVGAGPLSRERQEGGMARLGFYVDALENPERSGRVSVWVQDHEGFESLESGSAGAVEKLLRRWKIYCNQAEIVLTDVLLASRLATGVTLGAFLAVQKDMGFAQAVIQYSGLAYLSDWGLRLLFLSGISYEEIDARVRTLNHAFGLTRESFSNPAGTFNWAHFGVNLPENRKIDLIILRDPQDGPAFRVIVLGFDGIK